MARKNKEIENNIKPSKRIMDNLSQIKNMIRSIYTDTYSANMDDRQVTDDIKLNINQSIDQLMQNGYANSTVSNMSKLYRQSVTDVYNNQSELIKSLTTFEDPILSNAILNTWMNNRWIAEQEEDIRTVLKYMPKLKEAMSCKKDLVLSADHFSKDFCSFHKYSGSTAENGLFARRMEELKRAYNLPENLELWYEHAQNLGESFIHIAPYNEEFVKLLRNKANTRFSGLGESTDMTVLEATTTDSELLLSESSISDNKEVLTEAFKDSNITGLKVNLHRSGLLESAIKEIENKERFRKKNVSSSITESYNMFLESTSVLSEKTTKFDRLIPDELSMDTSDYEDSTQYVGSTDGVYDFNDKKINVKVPGCIVRELDRKNTIPIYVENECMGYYYIEVRNTITAYSNDPNVFDLSSNGMGNAIYHNTAANRSAIEGNRQQQAQQQQGIETVLNYVTNQISQAIDIDFINDHQELRKQIYLILKHNNVFNNQMTGEINANIDITFLNPEDVIHIKFETDHITHRGISDLAYALFPAKLYSCMYITETIGHLTRGQDKRVYYIKQNVEQNISKTMMNVLVQLKKGNYGARQIDQGLNNILNITGRYNDLLIPLSSNGDAPVQIENMPGQVFTDNEEFLTRLEKMAIDATDIPYDLIEARQSMDYAIQATMTNSKVMRNTFKRQDKFEHFCSQIVTKIYNYEYGEYENIEMSLPAPVFLNVSNGSQLVNSTTDFINSIIETQYGNESDELKNMIRKRAFRYYMPTHLNIEKIDQIVEESKLELSITKPEQEE